MHMFHLSFLFSDKRGLLYPYTPDPSNPGDTRMLREEELAKMGGKNMEGVPAVLLQDILSSISSNNVILKLDVQGYECKVREGFNIGNHLILLKLTAIYFRPCSLLFSWGVVGSLFLQFSLNGP